MADICAAARPRGAAPDSKARALAGHLRRKSDEMSLDGNIAVYGLGIWANPMSSVDQRLRDLTVEPRQADVEASRQEEVTAVEVQVDLGVDCHLGREFD